MTSRAIVAGLAVGAAAACATPGPGALLSESNPNIQAQVEFDHGCEPERVRFIRSDRSHVTVDLDVCGVVRRYKAFGTGAPGNAVTWLDVTTLYPAHTLPAPPPPER
jgi:hypothetical protein